MPLLKKTTTTDLKNIYINTHIRASEKQKDLLNMDFKSEDKDFYLSDSGELVLFIRSEKFFNVGAEIMAALRKVQNFFDATFLIDQDLEKILKGNKMESKPSKRINSIISINKKNNWFFLIEGDSITLNSSFEEFLITSTPIYFLKTSSFSTQFYFFRFERTPYFSKYSLVNDENFSMIQKELLFNIAYNCIESIMKSGFYCGTSEYFYQKYEEFLNLIIKENEKRRKEN